MSKVCFQYLQESALHAGSDAGEPMPADVRRHLAGCAECRDTYRKLRKDLALLQRCETQTDCEKKESSWPELSSKIRSQRAKTRSRDHVNGWIAAVSMTAACLALFLIPVLEPQPNAPAVRSTLTEGPAILFPTFSADAMDNDALRTTEMNGGPLEPKLIDIYSPRSDEPVKVNTDEPVGLFSP